VKLDKEYYELKNLLQQAFSIFSGTAHMIGRRTSARHAADLGRCSDEVARAPQRINARDSRASYSWCARAR
jgi:hypothetical protein